MGPWMSVSGVAFKGLPCRDGVLMKQMHALRVGLGRMGPDNVRLSPSVFCISLFCICKEYVALL